MTTNIRYIVPFFFLIMSFIPFILMTDLFPFMRFGMFAETVQSTPQKEKFSLQIHLPNGRNESLSERQIGLDESHLNYLARTYFYNHELDFFAVHLKKSGLLKKKERLIIIHKTLEGNQWKQDILFDQ
ncbi:MAG: hypothetical protein JWM14_3083 [Chitinophagaceae bacterium]|nr:hypothetical protein [Chitinophagaceae bacterium]